MIANVSVRFWLLLLLAIPLLAAARLQDGAPNRAAVVVRVGDDEVETRCVIFDEETISGQELLARSGLDLVLDVSGAGVFVCSVAGEGCPASDCLCQCRGEPCSYWSYWRWQEGEWQYAGLGAAATQVSDGTVDGWSWGPGSVTSAIAPPPVASFEDVCAAPAVAAPAVAPPAAAQTNWLPYALFLLLAALLGASLLLLQRRRVP